VLNWTEPFLPRQSSITELSFDERELFPFFRVSRYYLKNVRSAKQKAELIAILDNIRSVHNAGSIFRTADGAGFSKVILCGVTPEPIDKLGKLRQDFAKVALGAERAILWKKEKTVGSALRRLRGEGFAIIALEQSPRARSCFALPSRLPKRIALLVGSETEGIQKKTLEQADHIIEIPMYGAKESLNVSVAFGIAAYALTEYARMTKRVI